MTHQSIGGRARRPLCLGLPSRLVLRSRCAGLQQNTRILQSTDWEVAGQKTETFQETRGRVGSSPPAAGEILCGRAALGRITPIRMQPGTPTPGRSAAMLFGHYGVGSRPPGPSTPDAILCGQVALCNFFCLGCHRDLARRPPVRCSAVTDHVSHADQRQTHR